MDIDQILNDVRQHISNLQDKLQVANTAANKGQVINEKITLMKEVIISDKGCRKHIWGKLKQWIKLIQYQDKTASLNSCWRTRNRNQLVSNLQQESRQILALEEENRQLRFALKEMEDGLHLIMNDYRKVLSGFMRAESLSQAASFQNKQVGDKW